MANQNNRPMFSRARQRSMNRKRIIGGAAVALVLVVALALLLSKGKGPDRAVSKPVEDTRQAEGEPLVSQQAEGEPLAPQVTATPKPEATSKPTP